MSTVRIAQRAAWRRGTRRLPRAGSGGRSATATGRRDAERRRLDDACPCGDPLGGDIAGTSLFLALTLPRAVELRSAIVGWVGGSRKSRQPPVKGAAAQVDEAETN